MKVYVVTSEPYHDNSSTLGVYSTLERAQQSQPKKKWRLKGYYIDNWPDVVCEEDTNQDPNLLIKEFELDA